MTNFTNNDRERAGQLAKELDKRLVEASIEFNKLDDEAGDLWVQVDNGNSQLINMATIKTAQLEGMREMLNTLRRDIADNERIADGGQVL